MVLPTSSRILLGKFNLCQKLEVCTQRMKVYAQSLHYNSTMSSRENEICPRITNFHSMSTMKNSKLKKETKIQSNESQPANNGKTDQIWKKRLEQLNAFKKENNHTKVPQTDAESKALASWTSRQRRDYKKFTAGEKSSMTQSRIDLLNALGFAWELPKTHHTWEDRIQQLEQFRKEHGHTSVPQKYDQIPGLGSWVSRTRRQYHRKKKSFLTTSQIETLNKMQFCWEAKGPKVHSVTWVERLAELKQFKVQYGHTRVPRTYPENQKLSNWVHHQRSAYRLLIAGEESTMIPGRAELLDDLDFAWEVPASGAPSEL